MSNVGVEGHRDGGLRDRRGKQCQRGAGWVQDFDGLLKGKKDLRWGVLTAVQPIRSCGYCKVK